MHKAAVPILFAALALAGCAGNHLAPQSRTEFVAYSTEGRTFSMMDSHVANRKFDLVVATLKQKSQECLDGDANMTRRSGGIQTMSVTDRFRTDVRIVSPGRAELTTQYTSTGIIYLQKIPDGGFYSRAADIERLSPTTTKITYYGPSFDSSKKVWAAMKQWSDGQAAPCPE